MEEYIDIWNAEGQPTGESHLKEAAHLNGWFHPTVHIWFYTDDGNILLQQRGKNKETFPNLWDVSVAGHVMAAESIMEGALREIEEEIGLKIASNALTLLAVSKNTNMHPNGIHDKEFQHVFIGKLPVTMSALSIQEEEMEAIRLFSAEELELMIKKEHPEFNIVPSDMQYYRDIIATVKSLLS